MTEQRRFSHPLTAVFGVALLTVPWLSLHTVFSTDLAAGVAVALSDIAVLGASFLLAQGVETAGADVPRAFALTIPVALAVAPRYAVDALCAWETGISPGTPESAEVASLAVANMTGANRILIGIGWLAIALFTVYRARDTGDEAVESRPGFLADVVRLNHDIATEILFLFAAIVFAFFVPLGAGIGAVGMFVLVGLYVAYIFMAMNSSHEDEEQIGAPAYLQPCRKPKRIATTPSLFVFSGIVILVAVEPFAHDLEALGKSVDIPSFLIIQWVTLLASESPELIVMAYSVNKARSTAGFNVLVSSKLNQWTLLIGTLMLAYSLPLGYYGPLPLDTHQTGELWLTVAQSYSAIAILITFSISLREAVALLGFSLAQFVYSVARLALALPISGLGAVTSDGATSLIGFSVAYPVVRTTLFVRWREQFIAVAKLSIRRVHGDYGANEIPAAVED